MSCNLFEINTEDDVNYEALSYVWGQYRGNNYIMCNGSQLLISHNVDIALRHLRYQRGSRALWIDQICLNQADELETGDQIPLMAKIYSKASAVLIWLGIGNEITDVAMDSIPVIVNKLEERDTLPDSPLPEDRGYEEDQMSAINYLLHLPWFMRVWTLLEAAVAEKCFLICGKKRIELLHLLKFNTKSQVDGRGHWRDAVSSITSASDPSGPRARYEMAHVHAIAKLKNIALNQGTRQKEPLFTLLNQVRTCASTKRRDKIYAVYHFLPQAITNSIDERPRYSGYTVEALFTKVAAAELIERQQISILCAAGTAKQNLTIPSWVPDWTYAERHHSFTLLNQDCKDKGHGILYQASGQHTLNQVRLSGHDPVLHIEARILGSILDLAPPFLFNVPGASVVSQSASYGDKLEKLTSLMAERRSQIQNCMKTAQFYEPYQTGTDLLSAVRRTLVAGVKPLGGGNAIGILVPASDAEIKEDFDALDGWETQSLPSFDNLEDKLAVMRDAMAKALNESLSIEEREASLSVIDEFSAPAMRAMQPYLTSLNLETKAEMGAAPFSPLEFQQIRREIFQKHVAPSRPPMGILSSMQEACKARVFFVMKQSFLPQQTHIAQPGKSLGLAPMIARPGDLVCIIIGCPTPFLVRPAEEGSEKSKNVSEHERYQLLGECYVHSFMNGEAMDMGEFETREIALV